MLLLSTLSWPWTILQTFGGICLLPIEKLWNDTIQCADSLWGSVEPMQTGGLPLAWHKLTACYNTDSLSSILRTIGLGKLFHVAQKIGSFMMSDQFNILLQKGKSGTIRVTWIIHEILWQRYVRNWLKALTGKPSAITTLCLASHKEGFWRIMAPFIPAYPSSSNKMAASYNLVWDRCTFPIWLNIVDGSITHIAYWFILCPLHI